MKQLNVGLLGIGTVGGGTFTVLTRNAAEITRRTGVAINVVQVADRNVDHAKTLTGGSVDVTSDAFAVVSNPKVDVVFGMHIESWIPAGEIQYKQGAFMASSDWFSIKVKGKSAHGAQPWLSVDPISVSAQIIEGLQNIVSRQMDLTKAPIVITVGKIHGGVRNNIIPEECLIDGTIRTLDSKMQTDINDRIRLTATKIAEASNAIAEVNFVTKTLVTYNTPDLVEKMLPSLQTAAGKNNVRPMEWVTGAEDFSYFGTKAPAFFFYFGGMPRGNDAKNAPPHHTPDFMIDDSKLFVGVKTFCQLVFDYPKAIKN